MDEIRNAKIDSTFLGIEDHGILTFYIKFNYGYCLQSFGGIALIGQGKSVDIKFLEDLLKVVGVDSWEKLVGKHVRVIVKNNGVSKIGNILEDKWFEWGEKYYERR